MAFIADDLYEIRWPDGRRELVPITYSKGAAMKKRTIETRDSATHEELVERLVRRLNQQTAAMEQLLGELERARGAGSSGERRRTYDAAAKARDNRACEAEAGRDFEAKSRRYHRKTFDPHTQPSQESEEPAQRRRTFDAEGESPEAQFEKGARRLREQMLAKRK